MTAILDEPLTETTAESARLKDRKTNQKQLASLTKESERQKAIGGELAALEVRQRELKHAIREGALLGKPVSDLESELRAAGDAHRNKSEAYASLSHVAIAISEIHSRLRGPLANPALVEDLFIARKNIFWLTKRRESAAAGVRETADGSREHQHWLVELEWVGQQLSEAGNEVERIKQEIIDE